MRRFIHDVLVKANFMLNELMKDCLNGKTEIAELQSIVDEKTH